MSESAVAYVSLAIASPGIGKDIEKDIEGGASRGSKSGSDSILKNIAGVTAKIGGIAAGIGTALILKGGWDRLIQIEDATASMTVALGDATKAGELLDKVMAVVTGTPFTYSNFAAAASNLAGFGIQADKIPGILTAISNAASTKGSEAQVFADRLGTSFGQMAARGVIGMEQINSLSDVGVNGLAILANSFGLTTDEMSKMISKGAVPATEAIDILVDGIENGTVGVAGATTAFAGMAAALGGTTSGKLAILRTSFVNLGATAIAPLIPMVASLADATTEMVKGSFSNVGALAASFSEKLTPSVEKLSGWLSTLDFGAIAESVTSFSPLVQILDLLKPILPDLIAGFEPLLPLISALASELGGALLSVMVALIPHITSLAAVAGDLVTGSLAEILPQLTDFTRFLGENADAVVILIAGLVAWKAANIGIAIGATVAGLVKQTAGIIANTAAWIANKAQTVAIMALYAGEFVKNIALTIAGLVRQSAAWVANTAAKVANGAVDLAGGIKLWIQYGLLMLPQIIAQTSAWVSNTASLIAQKAAQVGMKVATVAGVAAMGIATAAQWAWNAAMSANPISLIIIAIVALIAGLIWFFTQTELGQEIWANFTQFLAEAWANISQFFIDAWTNISLFFTEVWTGIVAFFVGIWEGIVAFITAYINLVLLIITTVVGAIVDWWNAVWAGISSFFSAIWAGIVGFVTGYINTVLAIITAVVTTISSVWSAVWNGIVSFFTGVWNNIIATINTVQGVFASVFNGIAGIVRGAFEGVVGVVKSVINGIIGAVNGAIDGINSVAGAIGGALGINLSVGKIPMLAEGGIISKRPGGIIANIGEGRYDEAVVPLSPKFMDALAGGSSGDGAAREVNQTNNFYEQKTDPRVLLREAGRELKAAGL